MHAISLIRGRLETRVNLYEILRDGLYYYFLRFTEYFMLAANYKLVTTCYLLLPGVNLYEVLRDGLYYYLLLTTFD